MHGHSRLHGCSSRLAVISIASTSEPTCSALGLNPLRNPRPAGRAFTGPDSWGEILQPQGRKGDLTDAFCFLLDACGADAELAGRVCTCLACCSR